MPLHERFQSFLTDWCLPTGLAILGGMVFLVVLYGLIYLSNEMFKVMFRSLVGGY